MKFELITDTISSQMTFIICANRMAQYHFFIRTYNLFKPARNKYLNKSISLNDGSLGSLNDEERSEMRYVM